MDKYNKIIGKNIRIKRKQRGLSIEELAKEIKMLPGFLGLIERGDRGTNIKNLVNIADYLGVTLEQLIRYDLSTNQRVDEIVLTRKQKNLIDAIDEMSDNEVSILAELAKILNKYYIN